MTTSDKITAVLALPSADQLSAAAREATSMVAGLAIGSDTELQLVVDDLRDMKAKRDKLEERRLAITRPMDQAKGSVMDLFRGPLQAIDDAIEMGKRACLAYTRERDRKLAAERAERERAAQAERDRLAAEARELQRKAAAEQDAQRAQQLRDQADAVKVEAITTVAPILPAPAALTGSHNSGGWNVVADDPRAIAQHLLQSDPELFDGCFELKLTKLRSLATLRNGKLEIPGLRVVARETMVLR